MFTQRLVAENLDINGNKLAIWMVYDSEGYIISVYKEYVNQPRETRGFVSLPQIIIRNNDYKNWISEAKKSGILKHERYSL